MPKKSTGKRPRTLKHSTKAHSTNPFIGEHIRPDVLVKLIVVRQSGDTETYPLATLPTMSDAGEYRRKLARVALPKRLTPPLKAAA